MIDPPPHRHRGLYWAAVLLAVVAVIVGSIVAWVGYAATAGPDGAVKDYFRALQSGNAAAALGFGDLPAGPHSLLTDEVLQAQQRIAPLQDIEVSGVDRHGNAASVTMHYQLGYPDDPQQRTDTITLIDRGGRWRMTATAIATTIHLQQAYDRATILGSAIPQGQVLLFPGAVPLEFDTPYLALDPTQSSVDFGQDPYSDVDVQVSSAGRSAVAKALSDALKPCVAAHAPAASTCPLPSDRYVPGTLSGKIVGSVANAMLLGVSTDPAGVITIDGQIGFDGSYSLLDFNNIARQMTGKLDLPLGGLAYAIAPIQVRWGASS